MLPDICGPVAGEVYDIVRPVYQNTRLRLATINDINKDDIEAIQKFGELLWRIAEIYETNM
jgi:hypothetical protein